MSSVGTRSTSVCGLRAWSPATRASRCSSRPPLPRPGKVSRLEQRLVVFVFRLDDELIRWLDARAAAEKSTRTDILTAIIARAAAATEPDALANPRYVLTNDVAAALGGLHQVQDAVIRIGRLAASGLGVRPVDGGES